MSSEQVVQLPSPIPFPTGEFEWQFASQEGDGYVNLDQGRIELNVADMDGYTVISGAFPNRDLAHRAGLALLAAANLEG